MTESILLVIDQDSDVTDGISVRLRSFGYHVIAARNMADGLAVLDERRPHAVLVDIELPEPSGLAMLRDCLKSAALRKIPVISLSNSQRLQHQARIAGARAYVDKPFKTDALLTAVRVALSKTKDPVSLPEFSEMSRRVGSIARIDEIELSQSRPVEQTPKCQGSSTERQAVDEHSNPVRKAGGMRVLVVDDDAEIRCGAKVRLQAAGYEVIAACDGAQALTVASQYHPDAILLDVRMPCMDGLTVLCRLRARPETADIPVVMLSASIVDEQAALDAGARFFMKKPYQASGLLTAVSTAIGHWPSATCDSQVRQSVP